MRSLKLIALLAAFVSGYVTLAGAYCLTNPTVEEEFKSSDLVIAGTVIISTNILDSDGFIRGTFYTIRVSEVFKGSPGKTVELYSENTSGRFPMEVGTSYLIFAYESTFEGIEGPRLAIDYCGNSGTLKQSKKVLTIVRKLSKRPNTALEPTPTAP
jgi:hypothetical protein